MMLQLSVAGRGLVDYPASARYIQTPQAPRRHFWWGRGRERGKALRNLEPQAGLLLRGAMRRCGIEAGLRTAIRSCAGPSPDATSGHRSWGSERLSLKRIATVTVQATQATRVLGGGGDATLLNIHCSLTHAPHVLSMSMMALWTVNI